MLLNVFNSAELCGTMTIRYNLYTGKTQLAPKLKFSLMRSSGSSGTWACSQIVSRPPILVPSFRPLSSAQPYSCPYFLRPHSIFSLSTEVNSAIGSRLHLLLFPGDSGGNLRPLTVFGDKSNWCPLSPSNSRTALVAFQWHAAKRPIWQRSTNFEVLAYQR